MVAMAAGAVKREIKPPFFRIARPVKFSAVNIKILDDVAGTSHAFDHEKLKEVSVRKMTVHTLGRKALAVLTAVDRLLPRVPEGCHHMAGHAKGICVGGLDHETGCQYSDDCQDNPDEYPKPPAPRPAGPRGTSL